MDTRDLIVILLVEFSWAGGYIVAKIRHERDRRQDLDDLNRWWAKRHREARLRRDRAWYTV